MVVVSWLLLIVVLMCWATGWLLTLIVPFVPWPRLLMLVVSFTLLVMMLTRLIALLLLLLLLLMLMMLLLLTMWRLVLAWLMLLVVLLCGWLLMLLLLRLKGLLKGRSRLLWLERSVLLLERSHRWQGWHGLLWLEGSHWWLLRMERVDVGLLLLWRVLHWSGGLRRLLTVIRIVNSCLLALVVSLIGLGGPVVAPTQARWGEAHAVQC